MGYAIFTARKLMLTNRINQMNFRLMQLSQQKQSLADQAGRWESAMAATRNMFSSIGNMFQLSMRQNTQTLLNSAQNADGTINYDQAVSIFNQALNNNGYNFMTTNEGLLLTAATQMMDAQNEFQLKEIKDLENNIDLEMKRIDTQLKAAQAELQEVEKTEESQIKNSAPKFA